MRKPLETRVGSDWIQTFSGRQFWPLRPRAADVHVPDIAHALSLTCRYTGHVRHFYSVAEHSYHVSQRAAELAQLAGKSHADVRLAARLGLMHDASEAYLPDLASPVKRSALLATYRQIDDGIQWVICDALGLPRELPPEVKQADLELLATERLELLGPSPAPWGALPPPLPLRGFGWSPAYAESQFMRRFTELAH